MTHESTAFRGAGYGFEFSAATGLILPYLQWASIYGMVKTERELNLYLQFSSGFPKATPGDRSNREH